MPSTIEIEIRVRWWLPFAIAALLVAQSFGAHVTDAMINRLAARATSIREVNERERRKRIMRSFWLWYLICVAAIIFVAAFLGGVVQIGPQQ